MTVKVVVLDRGFVELQDFMGNDLAVVNAARVSYLGDSKGEEADAKLERYLWLNGHNTPFEMTEWKFRVKAPIMVARQWMRYRAGSFSEQSRRSMTVEAADEFYIPRAWRTQGNKSKQMSEGILTDYALSIDLTQALLKHIDNSLDLYEEALGAGIAREQARVFLPAFALYTTFIWKVDGRNLMHFLAERMHPHAQWEIREYANAIFYQMFEPLMPIAAALFKEKHGDQLGLHPNSNRHTIS